MRNLPPRRGDALDVGCGTGVLLEKLADNFEHVTGVDANNDMADGAARRVAKYPEAIVRCEGSSGFAAATDDGGFDLITMVAVLHHLDLDETLGQIPRLLAPGGRLLVVGLARVDSPTDVAIDITSAVLNPLVGLAKHPRAATRSTVPNREEPAMPMKDTTMTVTEIGAAAGTVLPGAALRRRLFFRYTLRWDKPVSAG